LPIKNSSNFPIPIATLNFIEFYIGEISNRVYHFEDAVISALFQCLCNDSLYIIRITACIKNCKNFYFIPSFTVIDGILLCQNTFPYISPMIYFAIHTRVEGNIVACFFKVD
jgi:hypothetical protein